MITTVPTMLALIALAQDTPSLEELVTRLGHNDIEQRVQAVKALVRLEEASVPVLTEALASCDLEVIHRARYALHRIEERIRLRPVYRERIPFSLDLRDISMRDAMARISEEGRVTFRAGDALSRRNVTLKMNEGTLLEAVDLLCRSLGDTQWYYDGHDVIAFRSRPFLPRPIFYSDCFRISIRSIETQRVSNFAEGSGGVTLFLDAQAEQGVRVLGMPAFTISEVLDESGRALVPGVYPVAELGPRVPQTFVLQGEPSRAESRPFWFSGLGASARRLQHVRGMTSFSFSMGTEEAVLELLSNQETRQVGEWTIRILANHGGILKLGISRDDRPIDMAYLESDSVVIWDEEGEEHALIPAEFECYQLPENQYTEFTFRFDRSWKTQANRMSFRLIRGVHLMKVPFEFRDVPLP